MMMLIDNPHGKPTVTELLNLLNKPALMKWANKIGLQGVSLDTYRAKVRNAGTNLHRQIERYVREGVPIEDARLAEALPRFLVGKEILGLEQSIETEWFIGRYDVHFRVGKTEYVGDWKSSTKVYLEHILQLTAYRMAKPECAIAVISVPACECKPITVRDFAPYEQILRSLSAIYQCKKQIDY